MKRVLIADDNASIRIALRAFLQNNAGFQVCGEAADGLEAVRKANEEKPDVILMDLSMPAMNGIQAASILRGSMPGTRIVIFTLYSDLVGKALAKAAGVDLVLAKTEGTDALTEALRFVLALSPNKPPA